MEDEKIEELFSNIIRTILTEKEFWEWVSSWKDINLLCEEAEEWDISVKKATIEDLFQVFPRLKKEFDMDKEV